MKWSKTELLHSMKDLEFDFNENLAFDPKTFATFDRLRNLQDVMVNGIARYDHSLDRVYFDLDITGTMIVPCAITFEDLALPFHICSTEVFAFDHVEADEDVHEVQGEIVEILPVIFQLILLEVPIKAVKEGITKYPSGDGWEVLSEEDYNKQKQNAVDPRLAKLKEFKLKND